MLFNTFTFAALLVPALLLYWSLPWQRARLFVLFVASAIFYAFHHWPSLFLLLGTIGVNYAAARVQERRRSKALLLAIVCADLSVLLWFKYAAFIAREVVRGLGLIGVTVPPPPLSQWLPLGISFFTFQVIAYQVDVYRKEIPAERSLLVFAVFKSFFAQLIAGPIVRGKEFLPRLRARAEFSPTQFHHGVFLFAVGLFLKVGVADVLRQFADEGFLQPQKLATSEAWLYLVAFTFQLFADFWGYSTMARGIGELFGLELPLNFAVPYLSDSLQTFWRRWHITLSNWFRDYVYIPLGGNRAHGARNLLITMTVAGVWHGAGWTFVLWGALHGAWLVLERKLGLVAPRSLVARVLRTALVFIGVCLLWVLFRAPGIDVAAAYYARLLLPPYTTNSYVPETLAIWLIGFAVLHPFLAQITERDRFLARPAWQQAAITWVMLIVAMAYGGQKYDFVYFAF
jgi:alginate O-acetyltransferase complex protein AlgI